ncbi:MAG: ABC transporter substrate-binding protein [Spirochaetales bacterium]|nr:ABC transporter substrate-binding protein [Spirochaetales bacterium]
MFLTGCGKDHTRSGTFTDSYGRRLDLALPVRTVVSAAPNITECFFALDLQDLLVGRTQYCTYPPEAAGIKSIGNIMDPSLETIIMLRPDLVVASSHFTRTSVQTLDTAGIPVAVLKEENTFEGMYRMLEKIGVLTGHEKRSAGLVKSIQDSVMRITVAVKNAPRPRVYYVVGFGEWGDYTAGGDTFINDLIEMAGGTNIAADISGWSFNLESLILRDPDIIICPDDEGMAEAMARTNGYRDLRAVKQGHVYTVDRDLVELQGPRMLDGLVRLAEIFHPELF